MPRMKETLWVLAKGFPPSPLAMFFLASFFEGRSEPSYFTNITFNHIIAVLQQIRQVRGKRNQKMSTLNLSRSTINASHQSFVKFLSSYWESKLFTSCTRLSFQIQHLQEVLCYDRYEIRRLVSHSTLRPFSWAVWLLIWIKNSARVWKRRRIHLFNDTNDMHLPIPSFPPPDSLPDWPSSRPAVSAIGSHANASSFMDTSSPVALPGPDKSLRRGRYSLSAHRRWRLPVVIGNMVQDGRCRLRSRIHRQYVRGTASPSLL